MLVNFPFTKYDWHGRRRKKEDKKDVELVLIATKSTWSREDDINESVTTTLYTCYWENLDQEGSWRKKKEDKSQGPRTEKVEVMMLSGSSHNSSAWKSHSKVVPANNYWIQNSSLDRYKVSSAKITSSSCKSPFLPSHLSYIGRPLSLKLPRCRTLLDVSADLCM